MNLRPRLLATVALAGLLVAAAPRALDAQDEGLRIGVYFGGTSLVGVLFDYFDSSGSTELTLGTFSFRDLSVSVVRRQRFGGGEVQGTVGVGLWAIAALPGNDERTGLALVARAPVGVDWNLQGDHFLTVDANLNRALWVRRTDPEDLTPPAARIVPLPGVSYRWLSN